MKKKYLLLAEKPSVSRELEAVYKKHGNKFEIDFDSFHGHLMRLPDADYYDPRYKEWKMEDLPIMPEFCYVQADKESCERLLRKIKNGHYDGLINACDSGREGELIFYSFYEGNHLTLPVLRLWASDVTEETLAKALDNLIDEKEFAGLRAASKLRSQFDWLVGINMTRMATINSDTKLPMGRVQSPTLNLIVQRELEIKNFVPEDFFELKAQFKTADGGIYTSTYVSGEGYKVSKFKNKAELEKVAANLGKDAKVANIETKNFTLRAPSLYSLIELQKDAAQYFGFRADKTLDIAQHLYELKFTTYPRTDSRFLPTAMRGEIKKHLAVLASVKELAPYLAKLDDKHIDDIMNDNSYVDNAKIVDHHAIIPTMQKADFKKLNDDEIAVYLLICKRLLAIFMDPFVQAKTVVMTQTSDGSMFKGNGKMVVQAGYSVLYPVSVKDVILPKLDKDDEVEMVKHQILAKQTKPPVRYNTKTILEAMQNIGQKLSSAEMRKILRDTAGLGTSATRAEILKKLERYGFVVVNKQTFVPTEFGMAVCQIYGKSDVFSPAMTATWEEQLRKVENGDLSPAAFQDNMIKYVVKIFESNKDIKQSLLYMTRRNVGKCPCCGKTLRAGKNYYICEDYKSGDTPCSFCMSKVLMGHTVTQKELKTLLSGEPVKMELTKKDGKKFTASVVVNKEGYSLQFGSNNQPDPKDDVVDVSKLSKNDIIGTCPFCGGHVYEGKNYFLCTNKTVNGCSFKVSKNDFGTTTSRADVIALIKNGEMPKKKYTWSNGKTSMAKRKIIKNQIKFEFDSDK